MDWKISVVKKCSGRSLEIKIIVTFFFRNSFSLLSNSCIIFLGDQKEEAIWKGAWQRGCYFCFSKVSSSKAKEKKNFKVKVEELLWELFLLWFIRLLRVQKLEVTYFHQQSELFHVPNREPLGNPSFKWNIGFCALVTSSSGHFLKRMKDINLKFKQV